jgi:hypothetical protein
MMRAIEPQAVDYNIFLKKDEWSCREIARVFDPTGTNKIRELIEASVFANKLTQQRWERTGLGGDLMIRYFDPLIFVRWALDKQIPIPEAVSDWYAAKSIETPPANQW